jgi:hypothetical protein
VSIAEIRPEHEDGRLFSPAAFYVPKEQIQLAGGAMTLNTEDEAKLLESLNGTDGTGEMRVFFSVKGYKTEYGQLTWNVVVSDMVIDTE